MGVSENVPKTLGEGFTIEQPQEIVNAGEGVFESLENGARVCGNVKEGERKNGVAEVIVDKSAAVVDEDEASKVKPVEDGSLAVSEVKKIDADSCGGAALEGGNLDDSVINGVSSLLRMKEDKRGIKMDDDAGVARVKDLGSASGSIDVNDGKGVGTGDGHLASGDDNMNAGERNGAVSVLAVEKIDNKNAEDGVGLNAGAIVKDGVDAGMEVERDWVGLNADTTVTDGGDAGMEVDKDGVGLKADAIVKDGGDTEMDVGKAHVSETEINDAEEDNVEDVGHGFSVGDFVWGKIKNHPWWPGQIYDPSNASENALKLKAKGKLLVAYFGDGTFAWCYPSQLKPFEENFVEMANQTNTKNFLNAVRAAVDEVSKLVYYWMISSRVPDERRTGLIRPVAENAGVEGGVFVPDAGVGKLSVAGMIPVQVLTSLKSTAQVAVAYSALEMGYLKGLLSAFYFNRGGYELSQYHEPDLIPGLEDQRVKAAGRKTVEVRNQWPEEEELLSSLYSKQKLRKCPSISGRRKVKSIVEILGVKKGAKTPDNECDTTASGKKKKKGPGDENTSKAGLGKQTTMDVTEGTNTEIENSSVEENKDKNSRKRKEKTTADDGRDKKKEKNKHSELPDESFSKARRRKQSSSSAKGFPVRPHNGDADAETVDGGARGKELNKGKSRRNKKKNTVEDGEEGVKEENEQFELQRNKKMPETKSKISGDEGQPSSARERKKSKYLSPPYTSLAKGQRKKEIEAESLKVSSSVRIGVRMKKAASDVAGGTPSPKSESLVSQNRSKARGGDIRKGDASETLKTKDKDIDLMKVKAPSDVVLSEVRSAALGHYVEVGNSEVEEFIYAFRVSVYHDESNASTGKLRRKQKSKKSGLEGEKETEPVPTSPDLASQKKRAKKRKESDMGTQDTPPEPAGKKRSQHISASADSTSQKKRVKSSKKSDVGTLNSPERASKRKMSDSGVSNAPDSKSRRKKIKSNESDLDASKEMPVTEALDATKTAPKRKFISQTPKGKKKGSACLLVTFGLGSSLPGKEDIIKVYREFGVVNENETALFSNNSCAIVVFKKASDAEVALKRSQSENPFGSPNVTFELHYQSAAPEAQTPNEDASNMKDPSAAKGEKKARNPKKQSAPETTSKETSDVPFIKKKLEKMIAMLEKANGKLSKKMKNKLEKEMTGVLEKLSTTGQPASSFDG